MIAVSRTVEPPQRPPARRHIDIACASPTRRRPRTFALPRPPTIRSSAGGPATPEGRHQPSGETHDKTTRATGGMGHPGRSVLPRVLGRFPRQRLSSGSPLPCRPLQNQPLSVAPLVTASEVRHTRVSEQRPIDLRGSRGVVSGGSKGLRALDRKAQRTGWRRRMEGSCLPTILLAGNAQPATTPFDGPGGVGFGS